MKTEKAHQSSERITPCPNAAERPTGLPAATDNRTSTGSASESRTPETGGTESSTTAASGPSGQVTADQCPPATGASTAAPSRRLTPGARTETAEVPCPCGGAHDPLLAYSLGIVCARCGEHTGNAHQGHYWGLCKALRAKGVPFRDAVRELHFCCPDDCELTPSEIPASPGDDHGRCVVITALLRRIRRGLELAHAAHQARR